MKHKFAWVVLLVAYAAAFAANVGHFAWGYEIGWIQISTSVLYAAAWIWFVVSGRTDKALLQAAVVVGGLTAAGGVFGLLARSFGSGLFTLLGLATAGLTATPLYGLLRPLADYDLFYLAAAVLGTGWMIVSLLLKKSAVQKTFETDG